MTIFKYMLFLLPCAVLAQNGFNSDEAYKTPEGKHKVMYQGGDTKFNRITKNELAIDYLKKELAKLKQEVDLLKAKLNQ